METTRKQRGSSFDRDVRPLFRDRDRGAMLNVAKFDLWKHEDVAEHSEDILKRLEDGSMPCDQAWPEEERCRLPSMGRRRQARVARPGHCKNDAKAEPARRMPGGTS